MASDATILLQEISHGQQNPVVDQPQSFVASNDPQPHLLGPPGSFLPGQADQHWRTNPFHEDCPPGLEQLIEADEVVVQNTNEVLKKVSCLENNNKYVVKNSVDHKIFSTVEDSGCCSRFWCCSNTRSLELKIINNFGNEVIHLNRPLACACYLCACCLYPCCLQKMKVSAPPGNVIGTIEQEWSIFPRFKVKDVSGNVVLKIKVRAERVTAELKKLEVFRKKRARLSKGIDNFGITFPMELDAKMKAVLLSACFLIDFLYFESDREHGSVGDDGYEANDSISNDNSA
ncbi:hypothetical protein DAPPUDRAFT_318260 [Daphnia pulex]|uniref:Phospholipid scramblase n=1 Tax=Daphnia pulex TaxID=6669 RepID=E9GIA1_DAPPU|nr:hypothetical protein DAPPUDRAFT_318260 [Daphnia pulex]|eukprot:EFX80806.1 hypothetical protein DAPPUDRAFT_318260 [Daphnia pulex]